MIEPDVHEVAVHVRPQEISADQMGQVCMRDGTTGYVPAAHQERRGEEAQTLTELCQVFAGDKLVVLVDCRLRSLL